MLIDTFLPALIIFLLVMIGMAVGVIFSNRRITGSCGGLNAIPGVDECGVCGKNLRDGSAADCDRQR